MAQIPNELRDTAAKIFQFTEYFLKSRNKPGHVDQMAALEAISKALNYEEQLIDGEKRHCIIGVSGRFPGKYIRVILLKDFETVHNAFFDRSARKLIESGAKK